jgi:hypothetical protein
MPSSSTMAARTFVRLLCNASSVFGIPVVATSVGMGVTLAQPVRSAANAGPQIKRGALAMNNSFRLTRGYGRATRMEPPLVKKN